MLKIGYLWIVIQGIVDKTVVKSVDPGQTPPTWSGICWLCGVCLNFFVQIFRVKMVRCKCCSGCT